VKIPWTAAAGWGSLALLGGGEFSFGETEDADAAWLAKAPPGPIGFIPAASGSTDYVRHFGEYLAETFERPIEVIPIYRSRDARRPRNCERIAACAPSCAAPADRGPSASLPAERCCWALGRRSRPSARSSC